MRRYLAPTSLFLLSVLILTSVLSGEFVPVGADETGVIWTGKQLAAGRVPYRDFFEFTPPLAVYGVGAFARIAGASLASFRFLMLGWLTLVTLMFYGLLRSADVPRSWATAAALLVPGLFVPFWPASSYHWFAIGLGVLGLAVVAMPKPTATAWFIAGVCGGLAGLVMQTEGAWFLALLLLRIMLFGTEAKWRVAATLIAGAALPVTMFVAGLYGQGTLKAAFDAVILWPSRYYKQPGGENHISGTEFSMVPAGWVQTDIPGLLVFIVAASLPLVLIGLLATSAYLRKKEWDQRGSWYLGVIGTAFALMLFLMGRPDWTHLVFWLTPLLFLLMREVDWQAKTVRTRLAKGWVFAAVLAVAIRFSVYWTETPPNAWGIMVLDAAFQKNDLPTLVDEIPGVRERNQPIMYLHRTASSLYLYWSPAWPPVTWVLPPSMPYNSPDHYEALAAFAIENRIPWIVIPADWAGSFTTADTPIGDLLRDRYRREFHTSWGWAFARVR